MEQTKDERTTTFRWKANPLNVNNVIRNKTIQNAVFVKRTKDKTTTTLMQKTNTLNKCFFVCFFNVRNNSVFIKPKKGRKNNNIQAEDEYIKPKLTISNHQCIYKMNKTQENNKINRPHEQHIKGKQNITRNY